MKPQNERPVAYVVGVEGKGKTARVRVRAPKAVGSPDEFEIPIMGYLVRKLTGLKGHIVNLVDIGKDHRARGVTDLGEDIIEMKGSSD